MQAWATSGLPPLLSEEKDAPAAASALCLALSTSGMSTSNQATPVVVPQNTHQSSAGDMGVHPPTPGTEGV